MHYILIILMVFLSGFSNAQVFELPPFVSVHLANTVGFDEDTMIKKEGIISISKFVEKTFLDEETKGSNPVFIRTYNDTAQLVKEQIYDEEGNQIVFNYKYQMEGTNLVRVSTKEGDTTYKKTEIYNSDGNLVEDNCLMVPEYVACKNTYNNNRLVEKLEGNTRILYDFNNSNHIETITVNYYGRVKQKSEIQYDKFGNKLSVYEYEVTPDGIATSQKEAVELYHYTNRHKLEKVIGFNEFGQEILKDSIEYTQQGKPFKHHIIGKGVIKYEYDGDRISTVMASKYIPSMKAFSTIEKWEYSYDTVKPKVPVRIVKSRFDKAEGKLKPYEVVYFKSKYKAGKMERN